MDRDSKGKRSAWPSMILLYFMLHCWVEIDPTVGFFLKNCTVHPSINDSNRPKVLCYKMMFYSVPLVIPHNVESLELSFNLISQIKVDSFKQLTYLIYLNISNNQIRLMETGAFRDLVALHELNLAMNKLTTISNNDFKGLVNLTTIYLDNNLINRIESSAFSFLSNLNTVSLRNNKLQQIEQVQPIMKVPNLRTLIIGSNNFSTFKSCDMSNISLAIELLDLSWNPLEIFQITADVLPRLENLDISYTGAKRSLQWDVQDRSFLRNVNRLILSGIHISEQDIGKVFYSFNSSLKNLRLYDMKGLNIETLLKEACQIPTLRVLRLKTNRLTHLDDQLFLPCLSVNELDVTSNSIHEVSELTFKPLEQITILRLAHNRLPVFPSSVRYLTALEFLDLSFNKITGFSCSDFANMTQMTRLYLFRNHIFDLSPCVFKGLKNLQTLKLGSNKILTIKGLFNGLQKLEHLELRFNKLSSIKQGDFTGLCSLSYLDLVDNQISVIEKEAFRELVNLTQLYLSSNKITQVTIHLENVFSGLSNLRILELPSNYISYLTDNKLQQPPFSLLKSLTHLTIHSQGHKGLRNLPSNLLEGLTSLRKMHAGNMNIEFLHPDTFSYTPHLLYLDISKNMFTALTPEVFQSIPELTALVLSKARLQSLEFLIHANLSRLQFLQVRRNELTVINETLIHSLPALTYISLEENSFTCDCNNAWFIRWVENDNFTQVMGASRFICYYPDNLKGTKLLDLDTNSCTVDTGLFYFMSTTTLILLSLLGSFVYHFLYWQVIYTYYLFLAFLYDYRQRRTRKKLQSYQYDAFISYNARDEPWVLENLLPELEDKQGWSLCLHHRDFQPGKPILDNIVDGIYSSRKTICLISRHYLESEWCSREIQVASFRLFDEKKDVLVLVFLEHIPPSHLSPYHRMRKLVKKHTYLSWPKPGEDNRVFWQKLRVALQTREGFGEENPILSGMEH